MQGVARLGGASKFWRGLCSGCGRNFRLRFLGVGAIGRAPNGFFVGSYWSEESPDPGGYYAAPVQLNGVPIEAAGCFSAYLQSGYLLIVLLCTILLSQYTTTTATILVQWLIVQTSIVRKRVQCVARLGGAINLGWAFVVVVGAISTFGSWASALSTGHPMACL